MSKVPTQHVLLTSLWGSVLPCDTSLEEWLTRELLTAAPGFLASLHHKPPEITLNNTALLLRHFKCPVLRESWELKTFVLQGQPSRMQDMHRTRQCSGAGEKGPQYAWQCLCS